jgi:site-specific recombinase XerD
LLKLVSTPSSTYRYQVVRADGLPDVELTLFADDQMKALSPSSVPVYLREILSFMNWSACDPIVTGNRWSLFGPPAEVRNVIRQYLTVAARCKVVVRPDMAGLKATYVNETSATRINIRVFLTALKRFYDHLILRRVYCHENPLIHDSAAGMLAALRNGYRRAVREMEGRDPMPAASGIDPPSGIRLSQNFFRCVQKEWVPQTIDDPHFPGLIYQAGKNWGWGLREMCIVRTLFESGGRISEILDLTALDWAASHFLNRFRARNKGSFGERTKYLVVSQATAKLYRRYFDHAAAGRRACDRDQLTVNELERLFARDSSRLEQVPIFLTNRGTRMTEKLFRDWYWRPALRAAGFHAHPHQGRHWFVTNALRNIEQVAKNDGDRERRKQELIRYMSWKTGEKTLKAYEHLRREEEFVTGTLPGIHAAMKRRERESAKRPLPDSARHGAPAAHSLPYDEEFAILTGCFDED